MIPLDSDIMSMYPEDDILPGLSDCMIEDQELDAHTIFEEETAGFSAHPAELMHDDPDLGEISGTSSEQFVMLEKMGVLDPESDKINGHTFTAAALRNLYSGSSSQPDLVICWGSQAITEYHNPGAPSVTNSVLYGSPDLHNIPYETGQRTTGRCYVYPQC
ncbi:hypothetical protein DFJ58DRAFT_725102 [Suillus subalutaceus]|uniref:uncharacterized protein n=1 Tax=Suillus subalutaceus TaxID=48586 RepID=UPI001B87D538|nr:uncharacterized protein DFJ58DRAFT_725102 [Suillus subalutaceus]KAG1863207.1 hypothetical protein DFJ58DRAFT_725102 [Suillus subalutaceus]